MKLLMYEDYEDHITLYDNIDSQTLEQASLAVSRIHSLLDDLAFGDSMKEALDEFKEACQPIRQRQDIQHRRIERRAKAFLSEFFILLNHWEKKSKHHANPNMGTQFKELTHHAYDTFAEYGFIYNLRNYAIHGSDVVACIHGEIGCKYVLPLANRDDLLSSYKKWKPAEKAFIHSQPEYFDLLPIFEKSYQALQSLHYSLMDLELSPQTVSDCDLLISLYAETKKLNAAPGFWDIIEFFDSKGSPLHPQSMLTIFPDSCTRCYANWEVYPILKRRAEKILKERNHHL